VNIELVILQLYGNIGVVQVIIKKIFFNDISFVAQTNDKIIEALRGKYFHDMPQDRFISYLYHGLRL
jgi:hypothetical protein